MAGKVWNYIREKLDTDGALHFSLLDPDPLKMTAEKCIELATIAEDAGTDAIMVGGSTIFGVVDPVVKALTEALDIPTILFPGNITGVSEYADAMFFMSLLNSTNPYWIIGAQALGAGKIRLSGIETIPMGYLLIEPGKTAAWVGDAKCFPRDKPKLVLMYALAAQFMGFDLVYLEAGSGAEGGGVPTEIIQTVNQYCELPIITGGGCNDRESAVRLVEAGASIVVQGTYIEENCHEDGGKGLATIIEGLKDAASDRV